MKFSTIASYLGCIFLLGCATEAYMNKSVDPEKIPYSKARSMVQKSLNAAKWGFHVDYRASDVKLNAEDITIKAQRIMASEDGPMQTCVIKFSEQRDITLYHDDAWKYYLQPVKTNCEFLTPVWSGKDASQNGQDFINGMKSLHYHGPAAASTYALTQKSFKSIAEKYRNSSPKPELSEDVRRHKVQAEAAFEEKRYDAAIQSYEKALELAPWWPEGHYNRALLLGQLNNYEDAIDEMKKYLELAPNAPDARKAKDTIYVWEAKVPGSSSSSSDD